MTSTSTRPSQPPSAARATSESTSTNSKLPLQVSQDGELLGNERFIRRLFVPEDLESASEPISQSRLTLHSSHEGSSRRSSVEVKLTVDMNPAPGDEANGQPLAGNSQQTPLGAEGFSESIRMIDLPDVKGKYHAESLSSGSGRLSSSSSSAQHQMPQQQQQQQQQKQQQQQHFDTNDTCKFTFEKVFQKTFLGVNQSFLIAKKKKISSEEIAIRIRSGSGGRSEWLNELQVYLIPNFRHTNILDYLGSEQDNRGSNRRRSSGQRVLNELPRISDIRGRTYLLDSTEEQRAKELKENEAAICRDGAYIRLQYWLMNRFDGCIVLRDYLREQALEWPQLILIARGIVDGLHYLHENGDYQGIDKEEAAKNFVKSTRGALRRVAFIDRNSRIMMWPQHTCSIIHRNLSSMNVVLKGPELRPCIWNFGHSKIHHPFQPTNHVNLIDQGLKQVFMSSPYSSPEVLQERAYLTLTAMKSIDMYACGILFWELLSRCRLPKLAGATEFEDLERSEPDRYYEPFEYEFGPNPSTAMLTYAVCRLHARPKLKESWLVGQKTYSFSQTIQDLWDQDYDARVHTSTVMDRLERIDTSGDDSRHIFTSRNSRSFNLQTDWPPKIDSIQVPPFLIKCEPNLVLLD